MPPNLQRIIFGESLDRKKQNLVVLIRRNCVVSQAVEMRPEKGRELGLC